MSNIVFELLGGKANLVPLVCICVVQIQIYFPPKYTYFSYFSILLNLDSYDKNLLDDFCGNRDLDITI